LVRTSLDFLALLLFLYHTAMAWNKTYGDGVMTGESLHEVASKYVECLLTIQPATIAHMGSVIYHVHIICSLVTVD